ncbi:hypothetical protein BMS3Bbin02_00668 [bacterium BMS3Bbin02]|nr:hypothetical protein BMS3Bbin02_00668 [bacterium BMS3Bbin02]
MTRRCGLKPCCTRPDPLPELQCRPVEDPGSVFPPLAICSLSTSPQQPWGVSLRVTSRRSRVMSSRSMKRSSTWCSRTRMGRVTYSRSTPATDRSLSMSPNVEAHARRPELSSPTDSYPARSWVRTPEGVMKPRRRNPDPHRSTNPAPRKKARVPMLVLAACRGGRSVLPSCCLEPRRHMR